MYAKNLQKKVIVKSVDSNNMSNWQITYTIDTLTTVNNKFDILDKLNYLINNGIDRKNIFVTDKSFLISTNYKTYYSKGNVIGKNGAKIIKAANLGRLITMEYNEEIVRINCLFEYYKRINSIISNALNIRLRHCFLEDAFREIFISDIGDACMKLCDGAIQQIYDLFERQLKPNYERREKIINQIINSYKKDFGKLLQKSEKNGADCSKKFEYCFNRFDRPVVGVYNDREKCFEILNADQMYKNGEESINRIRLFNISKNSPVEMIFGVTGIMLSAFSYLAHRDNVVSNEEVMRNMGDVPQNSSEAINNIFSNEGGEIFALNETNEKVDDVVARLAEKNLDKLDQITDNRKVKVYINATIEQYVE